jgi:hypothetical protein
VVEHAPGLAEAAGHVADHLEPGGDGRGQLAGGPVPAGTEILPQLDGRGGGQPLALRRGQPGGAQQTAGIKRAEGTRGRVVGKHPGEEQRHVAQPAVDTGPFGRRDRVEQPGHPHRVELAEPAGPRPPAHLDPVTAAGHPGEGGQQLGQEQPPGRLIEEVTQRGRVEQRHPLPQSGALRHVVGRRQVDGGPLDEHREHQERGGRNRPAAAGLRRAQHRAEHVGMLEQPQQGLRVATQARGIDSAHRGQQAEVGVGEMARVLLACQQTVHYTTVNRNGRGWIQVEPPAAFPSREAFPGQETFPGQGR